MGRLVNRTGAASVTLLAAVSLAVGGCASSGGSPGVASCSAKHAAGPAGSAPGGSSNPAVAAGWTLPNGNLQNTRDVASPITT